MAERDPGLARLPPGRHGLPRELVDRNQRDRIAAGVIATVAEHGYHETTISMIATAAGVSRRTFYAHFASKQECYLDVFDEIGSHLGAAANEASQEIDDWPGAVEARLAAVLGTFAANPRLAIFELAVPPRAGGEIARHYRAALDRALSGLTAGLPPDAELPPEAVRRALLGGMASVVVAEVEAGRGQDLASLSPELAGLFVSADTGSLSL